MEKQMALLFVIGAVVGALALFGASSITGYAMWRLGPSADMDAVGIPGQDIEAHVLAVKDSYALGAEVKELLVIRDAVKQLKAQDVLMDTDQLSVIRGKMYDVNGEARMMSVIFLGVMRDGVLMSAESEALADIVRIDGEDMVITMTENAILSTDGVIRASEQPTAADALLSYTTVSTDVFALLGINVNPLGVSGGGTAY